MIANSLSNLNDDVQEGANHLKRCALRCNAIAAELRADKQYPEAEVMDRRAESLHCAAALAETRGLQT